MSSGDGGRGAKSSIRPTRRKRDRHDRGMRGTLTPPTIPIALSRAQLFDELVLESVERVAKAYPELEDVEFVVEEVPNIERRGGSPDPVLLGRVEVATAKQPARLVIHRRPIELRGTPGEEREDLVHDVVAELIAQLLGISPQQVDPDYRAGS